MHLHPMPPRLASLILLVGLATLAMPALGGTTSPVQGVGEISFAADLPVFYTAAGTPRVHLAVRVFESDLVYTRPGQPKRLSLRAKFARAGVTAVDTVGTIVFTPRPRDAVRTSTEPFRLIEMAPRIQPGTWAVTLELSDADGAQSRANAVLYVPEAARPRLSDPQYQLGAGAGRLPWPDRVYGVNQDTLEVYFEVDEVPLAQRRPFRFEVHDPRYGLLDEQELLLPLEAGRNAALWRLPVADFPEGSYALKIIPPWEDAEPRFSEFSVSWRIDRALEGGDELLLEAELALDPRDFETFQLLSRARQIEALDAFWADVDPTPGTDRNEVRDEFVARITQANRIYSTAMGPGARTDRGRLLVRYGPADEVDTEVMPRNGDELEFAIQNLHEIFTPEVDGVMARGDIYGDPGTGPRVRPLDLPGVQEDESVDFAGEIATDLRRNAARVGREGSFEVWKYRYIGRPLLEHHRPGISENQHIRFIFVDRRGVGDYRLEFSNLPSLR